MKKIIVATTALLAFCAAQAQQVPKPKFYGELGYTALKIEDAGVDIKPGLLRGIVGTEVHPNVGLEAMLAVGVKDDTVNLGGVPVEAKVERSYGLYVKPKIQATSQLELFARIGYARSKFKATFTGGSISESEGDLSYGAGLNYSFTRTVYGTVDYMSYYNKDGVKANGFTIGAGFRF